MCRFFLLLLALCVPAFVWAQDGAILCAGGKPVKTIARTVKIQKQQ
jgi:hypothetical protein